jgi:hypothetical protein
MQAPSGAVPKRTRTHHHDAAGNHGEDDGADSPGLFLLGAFTGHRRGDIHCTAGGCGPDEHDDLAEPLFPLSCPCGGLIHESHSQAAWWTACDQCGRSLQQARPDLFE